MIPVEKGAQVEGNREVVTMLEGWLERARQGKIAYGCVVMCESPIHMSCSFSGVIGMEMAAYYGLDSLKARIVDSLENRRPPAQDKSIGADMACYNLARAPSSYDFVAWLVDAELTRVREGAPAPLKVGFFFGQAGDKSGALHTEQRARMFEHVIRPALGLVGAVESPEAVNGRNSEVYSLAPTVAAYRRGETMPMLRPNSDALSAVKEFLGGDEPVVITLREADHSQHRNSNLPEWIRFADWLKGQGERVIFLRDSDKAMEPIDGHETCPAASIDLHARAALYASAKANLFVSNGPWMLVMFSERPWLMFASANPMDPYYANTPQGWKQYAGIDPPEQFPWSRSDQKIVWQPDTFENMQRAWGELFPQKAAA